MLPDNFLNQDDLLRIFNKIWYFPILEVFCRTLINQVLGVWLPIRKHIWVAFFAHFVNHWHPLADDFLASELSDRLMIIQLLLMTHDIVLATGTHEGCTNIQLLRIEIFYILGASEMRLSIYHQAGKCSWPHIILKVLKSVTLNKVSKGFTLLLIHLRHFVDSGATVHSVSKFFEKVDLRTIVQCFGKVWNLDHGLRLPIIKLTVELRLIFITDLLQFYCWALLTVFVIAIWIGFMMFLG